MIHFVGFRNDWEFWSAVKVWGRPDFIHYIHDKRMYGDVTSGDTIILGSKGHDLPHPLYSDQDHERH